MIVYIQPSTVMPRDTIYISGSDLLNTEFRLDGDSLAYEVIDEHLAKIIIPTWMPFGNHHIQANNSNLAASQTIPITVLNNFGPPRFNYSKLNNLIFTKSGLYRKDARFFDMNDDGNKEVIYLEGGSIKILDLATDQIQDYFISDYHLMGFEVLDIDSDGDYDIVLPVKENIYWKEQWLFTLINVNEKFTISKISMPVTYADSYWQSNRSSPSFKYGYFDRDKFVDLFFSSSSGILVLIGDDEFRLSKKITEHNGSIVDLGDYDYDGNIDVLTSDGKNIFLTTSKDGENFSTTQLFEGFYDESGKKFSTYDINKDGKVEIIEFGSQIYKINIWEIDFATSESVLLNTISLGPPYYDWINWVFISDFEGDGKADMLISFDSNSDEENAFYYSQVTDFEFEKVELVYDLSKYKFPSGMLRMENVDNDVDFDFVDKSGRIYELNYWPLQKDSIIVFDETTYTKDQLFTKINGNDPDGDSVTFSFRFKGLAEWNYKLKANNDGSIFTTSYSNFDLDEYQMMEWKDTCLFWYDDGMHPNAFFNIPYSRLILHNKNANEPPMGISLSSDTILSNLDVDDIIAAVSVEDEDFYDSFTYKIMGHDSDLFYAQNDTLYLNEKIEFDDIVIEIEIEAIDQGGNSIRKKFQLDKIRGALGFEKNLYSIEIFPNPVKEYLTIQWHLFKSASISDISGKELITSSSSTLDMRILDTGVYLLNLIGTNNERFTFRVIKE